MADVRLSDLTAAGTINITDLFEVSNAGVTKSVTPDKIVLAGALTATQVVFGGAPKTNAGYMEINNPAAYSAGASVDQLYFEGLDSTSVNVVLGGILTYAKASRLSDMAFFVQGSAGSSLEAMRIVGAATAATTQITVPGALAVTGAVTGGTLNGMTVTTSTGTFTLTNGKTFAVTNTITLSGTDAKTYTFPTTSATIARTDAAQTFTGNQTITGTAGDVIKFTGGGALTGYLYNDGTYMGLFDGAGFNGEGFLANSTGAFIYFGSIACFNVNTTGATGIQFNRYGAGTLTTNASGTISAVSDETWKVKDGQPKDPIAMIMGLAPGYYYWKDTKQQGAQRELGHYAQNVHEACGEEAAPTPEGDKPWGYLDRSVVAVHTLGIQNHEVRLRQLEARVQP